MGKIEDILTRLQNVAGELNKRAEKVDGGDEGIDLLQSNINLQKVIFYLGKWKGDQLIKDCGAPETDGLKGVNADGSILSNGEFEILFGELPEDIKQVINIVQSSLEINENLTKALLKVTIPKATADGKSRPVSAFGSMSKANSDTNSNTNPSTTATKPASSSSTASKTASPAPKTKASSAAAKTSSSSSINSKTPPATTASNTTDSTSSKKTAPKSAASKSTVKTVSKPAAAKAAPKAAAKK